MKERDENVLRRLWRRVKNPRGTVFLEFAVIAPLGVMLMCFAFDFQRILRTEQQLEIAARAMCDLESHYAKCSYDGNATAQPYPRPSAKKKIKNYLAYAMDLDSTAANRFFCKAECKPVPGILTILSPVLEFLDGKPPENANVFFKVISQIFACALDVFTMKTQRYFSEILPRDRELKVSFAANIPTLLPRKFYDIMGWTGEKAGSKQYATVNQLDFRRNLSATPGKNTLDFSTRERSWCTMPVMDSAANPPVTYSRQIKGIFSRYIPKWLMDILF